MVDPIHDQDAVDAHRRDEQLPTPDATEPVADPAAARECTVPVKPGYGQAAYRAGCEDEWVDRMAARYGGEW